MPQMKMLSFLDYAVYQLLSDLLLTTHFNVPHFGAVKTDAIGFKTASYLTLPQMANTYKSYLVLEFCLVLNEPVESHSHFWEQ